MATGGLLFMQAINAAQIRNVARPLVHAEKNSRNQILAAIKLCINRRRFQRFFGSQSLSERGRRPGEWAHWEIQARNLLSLSKPLG